MVGKSFRARGCEPTFESVYTYQTEKMSTVASAFSVKLPFIGPQVRQELKECPKGLAKLLNRIK